jgi:hypothetical protein
MWQKTADERGYGRSNAQHIRSDRETSAPQGIDMAEEKKDAFPWIQLIATVGTIVAALIGITPYLLKLNTPAPQTPTIVILTLPPAVTTPAPATTAGTAVETTPVTTQTTVMTTTVPTTGPPATETPGVNVTANQTVATTVPATIPTTTPLTTLPVPSITIALNKSTLVRGDLLFASGTTDAAVPQVSITVNSTTFQSGAVLTNVLSGGSFEFAINTTEFEPGDYTIWAAVPDTPAVASAPFVITAP